MIDLKHVEKPGNNFNKHDVYFGNTKPFSSFRDYAFGYFESEGIGFLTFIKYLR